MQTTYEILDDDGNVINTIVADEAFMAEHYAAGSYRIRADTAVPSQRPQLVLTSVTSDCPEQTTTESTGGVTEVDCPAGATLRITAELRDPESLERQSESLTFFVPFAPSDTAGRQITPFAVMTDGVVACSATFPIPGTWTVTGALLNTALPPDRHVDFSGLTVRVRAD